MYNPYLEEEEFVPTEPELVTDTPFLSEGKLASVKNLLKMKDFAKLGELSALGDLFSNFTKGKEKPPPLPKEQEGIMENLKQKLRLEEIDTGDVLLVFILIYLMLEGDDKIELAITLGILAFLWFID